MTAAQPQPTLERAPAMSPGPPEGVASTYEEFLVGAQLLDEIKQVAARAHASVDASDKLKNLRERVWGAAQAGIRRHAGGSSALTQHEIQGVKATTKALEDSVAAQRSDLQDFQSQLPVVLQAHAPGRAWLKGLYLGGMLLASLVFAGVLVPTLELLVFTDEATGQLVPGAAWKSGLTGFAIGGVLAVFSWLASSKNKDINPHNNTAEALVRLLPLFLGLSVAVGIAMFRVQQIGFAMAVIGMTVIECAIVGFIEVLAHRYAYRYADEPSTLASKISTLSQNIDFNLYAVEQNRQRLEQLETKLGHQQQAQEHDTKSKTGREGDIRGRFDAWVEQVFELYRPSGDGTHAPR